MNLDLPFLDAGPSELDEHLARIDRELDVLFLGELGLALGRDATVEELTPERPASDSAAA